MTNKPSISSFIFSLLIGPTNLNLSDKRNLRPQSSEIIGSRPCTDLLELIKKLNQIK